jgi:DNA-binding MarR family transcriptional regulator
MLSTNILNKLFVLGEKIGYIRLVMLRRGEQHPMHKLTEKQVNTIRELWRIGHRNVRVLARNNGVSSANIKKIVKNETWTHIN